MRKYLTKIDGAAPAPQGVLGAPEDNWRFAEMVNVALSAGLTLDAYNAPSDSDTKMLAQAVARYASAAIFCQDTGNANAYILKLTKSFVAPKAYFTGLRVAFYPAYTSTSASIINAFALGNKKVLRADGSAITPGDLTANRLTYAVYDESLDGGNGAFRLAPWAIPYVVQSPSAVPLDGEGVDVDGVYRCNLDFNSLTAATPVDPDVFAYFSQSLNGHRKVTLAQLLALIRAGLSIGNLSLPKIGSTLRIEERRNNLVTRQISSYNTWTKRPLSDVVINQITGASLNGSNQIILPKGTYRADFVGVIANTRNYRCRLYDTTGAAVLGIGTTVDCFSSNSSSPPSIGSTWFSLSQTSLVELQFYCVSGSTACLGDHEVNDIGSGNFYVDGWVSLIKEG